MEQLALLAWCRIRHDWRRSLVTAMSLWVALTSFAVLSAAAATQRLDATGTITENWRGPYDILVRPAAARAQLETERGWVRPGFVGEIGGGMTLDQWREIQTIPGVEVAAPLATLGVVEFIKVLEVDATDALAGRERALVRYEVTETSRAGHLAGVSSNGTAYLTRNVLDVPEGVRFLEGTVERDPAGPTRPCSTDPRIDGSAGVRHWDWCIGASASKESMAARDGRYVFMAGYAAVPVMVAAIDPSAEAALLGLPSAVVVGRPLGETEGVLACEPEAGRTWARVPALVSTSIGAPDVTYEIVTELLGSQGLSAWLAAAPSDRPAAVSGYFDDAQLLARTEFTGADLWSNLNERPVHSDIALAAPTDGIAPVDHIRIGPVSSSLDPLERLVIDPQEPMSATQQRRFSLAARDTAFRELTAEPFGRHPSCAAEEVDGFQLVPVGRFDPQEVSGQWEGLGGTPLDVYGMAPVQAADPTTVAVLGRPDYVSDLNPAGFGALAPSVLVPMEATAMLNDQRRGAPVSAIRVRVEGVTGFDDASRERIRVVADRIAHMPGVVVDITSGSSMTPQEVVLPATTMGVPELHLREPWSVKGVATTLTEAVDAKSVLLAGLNLISAGLTVGMTAAASVESRRRDFAVLSAVGWSAKWIGLLPLCELALLGSLAGLAAAATSSGLAPLVNAHVGTSTLWLSPVVGTLLAMAAGVPAAMAAARTMPAQAFAGVVPTQPRAGARLGAVPMALDMLRRRRGTALAAAIAVALPVWALTSLGAIVRGFSGIAVGTILGDALAIQVRDADAAAALVLSVLGLIAVADMVWLGVLADARSFATLRALGWTGRRVGMILVAETVLTTGAGFACGFALAVVTLGAILPAAVGSAVPTAGVVGAVALVGAVLVAGVTARQVHALPIARALEIE